MQMVAATKMRRSQEVALNARPYARKSLALLVHLLRAAEKEEPQNIFGTEKANERIALVVVTSDKGLAGSFNSAVLREAQKFIAEKESVDIVAVGKKGRDFFKNRELNIVGEFFQFSDIVNYQDVQPLADWILNAYEKQEYGTVAVCSTQFVSALVQKPGITQIFPLGLEQLQVAVRSIVPKTGKYSELAQQEDENVQELNYVLEPGREQILQQLARGLVRMHIAHLIFESNAAEHSSRMVAMKNATENADRLQEELQLVLNKARQAAITQELTEISTAKEALTAE
jgi:F-type H+-transporting ATPase subunit gamma